VNKRSAVTSSQRPPAGIVFSLSRKDLQHEWILTGCLVMAIAAVLSPLLLLFGLKYGTIETLRFRLIEDPRNREIGPLTSRSFNNEWFAQVARRPDVGFVMPMTRQIAATVTVQVKGRQEQTDLNIVPTMDHDPLILENGAAVPRTGECVLTHFAAEELKAKVGDSLIMTAKRVKGGQYESGMLEIKVAGILSLRASDLKSMYVRLQVLEAVERFKDGQGVPEFGWTGSTPTAYSQYNGLLVVIPQELTRVEELNLLNNTGFSKIERLTKAELFARTKWQIATAQNMYLLSTEKKPIGEESIDSVRHKLRGQNAMFFPWITPISATLMTASGAQIAALQLYALSGEAETAEYLHLTPSPNWGESGTSQAIMLPSNIPTAAEGFLLQIVNDKEALTFPVTPAPTRLTPEDIAFVPAKLAGILKLFQYRTIQYDRDLHEFVLSRRGYAAFRLYAKTIDDVDGLRRYFEGQGITVHTEAGRIKDVIDLDTYLTLIFWLIAAVGVVGGVTALLASLYAAVERKKRELGVLRLLGLSRPALFRYPIYQGMLIGLGGFMVAIIFFESMAMLINSLFAVHLQVGESFCRLPVVHTASALAVTIVIAMVAATFAAWRITLIEPAEALRDE
jgi:putative ABC transport system permease protein